MSEHRFRFNKSREYAFFNEHVHLLLVDHERDDKKDLFLILETDEDGTFVLDYPGELFTAQIQELVQSIFFVSVKEGEAQEKRYVLGAYFTCNRQTYALYYDRDKEGIDELVFFRADAKGTGEYDLQNITDQGEYQEVVEFVLDRYGSVLSQG
jgi:hypothetical protein